MTASLEARVIELERRCRRLQLAAIGAGALLFAACLSGAFVAPGRVLRAERFELVNAKGELRGALELDGTTPRLVLASPENESFVALCAGPSVTEERAGTAWFRFPGPRGSMSRRGLHRSGTGWRYSPSARPPARPSSSRTSSTPT